MVTKGQDGVKVAHLLVDHEAKDAHLSGTAVVQLDAALLALPLVALLVPAKVEEGLLLAVEVDLGSVAEITRELGLVPVNLGGIAVDHLHGRPGEEHLDPNVEGEGTPCVEAGGDVLGTGEANAGGGGEVSNDGKHGNAAVLQINFDGSIDSQGEYILKLKVRIEEQDFVKYKMTFLHAGKQHAYATQCRNPSKY